MTKDQESGDTHTIWNANKVSLRRKNEEESLKKKKNPFACLMKKGWTCTKKNLLKACLVDNRTRDNYQRIYQYNQ